MSKEFVKYLNKKRKKTILICLIQLLIVISILSLWELLANTNIIDSFITSKPSLIFKTIIDLYKGKMLWKNILITLNETLISFFIGSIIGLIISIVLWSNDFIAKVFDPFLTIINSLPKVALGPLIIIWIGANKSSIIVMALLISTIITIINIYQGFISVDYLKIKLMKTFKANNFCILRKLIIPANTLNIISTLKINISMTFIGVIMGEFLVSKEGIGYLIMYGTQVFNLNLVMSGILILCIMSAFLYYTLFAFETIFKRKYKE